MYKNLQYRLNPRLGILRSTAWTNLSVPEKSGAQFYFRTRSGTQKHGRARPAGAPD